MGLPFFYRDFGFSPGNRRGEAFEELNKGYKKQKAVTPDYLFANLKIKYYEKITMQICGVFLN